MTGQKTSDYSVYLQQTARALLGEPGEKRGTEWRYGTHGSLSVHTEKGTWYDHENETGGGTLDLVMREAYPDTVKAAISWLEEKGIKEKSQPERSSQSRKIEATYDYVDEHGDLVYQVVRFSDKAFRQRRPEGDGWSWSVKGVKQLPYRLPDMLGRPDATVLIVEGEKDADRLAAMGLVATCNSGGAGKWPASLTPYFEGRKVVILPDNDDAGENHAQQVAERLCHVADSVRIVRLPGLPNKGDASDWVNNGGTKAELVSLCKQEEPWVAPETGTTTAPPAPEPSTNTEPKNKAPFKPLGYSGNSYYYLPRGTEQVSEIRRGSHTSASDLLSLAPIEWWEMAYPKDRGGVDWQLAASDCMRQCEARGVYSEDRQRGRGAWYDNGRSVLHLGDRLLIDGEERAIADHHSSYIYTRQAPLETGMTAEPATDEEAAKVSEIFGHLNWSKDVFCELAAGWTVLAPICGALKWRPHVWLTAQRGAGKTWVQDNILHPLLGQCAMVVQGSTTEAGIRQRIKQDARPIIFDEAESEDASSQRRMQTVIELARQSSSDSSAEIVKGTVSGDGMAFRMRSMFLLGSVNVSLSQAADESRFTVLSLDAPEKTADEAARFEEFAKHVGNTLTPSYCASIRARSYRLAPVIRHNAQVFARAVAEELGSQRIGDQFGTLLAGAYSLYSSHEADLDTAKAWVSVLDFSVAREQEQASDEQRCLSQILQTQIQFDSGSGVKRRSIGEIVRCAAGNDYMDGVTGSDANEVLGRHGLRVDGDRLKVANSHAELSKVLRDTPWGSGWRRILARIEGAHATFDVVRFAGVRSRAVSIPIDQAV